jgi:hypothetical protein
LSDAGLTGWPANVTKAALLPIILDEPRQDAHGLIAFGLLAAEPASRRAVAPGLTSENDFGSPRSSSSTANRLCGADVSQSDKTRLIRSVL